MALKKPLLVLRKSKAVVGGTDNALERGELQIVGIIRQKFLFKTRPKALISSTLSPFLLQIKISSIRGFAKEVTETKRV